MFEGDGKRRWSPSLSEGSIFDVSCEVGARRSDPFEVSCGLRQGCFLSPLLFSLFINSIVARLKEAEVGVKCGSKPISMLLYADDAVIFAEDERSMSLGLDVLMDGAEDGQLK